jgi:hypothetical protein
MSVYFAEGGIKNNFALLGRLNEVEKGELSTWRAQFAQTGKFHSALSQKFLLMPRHR